MAALSQSPQSRQLSSYSRIISNRPVSVSGHSHRCAGALSSRNSARIKSTRFVRHDHAPSGSFFEACADLNRANPMEITRAASLAPGNACTLITPTLWNLLPPGVELTRIGIKSYRTKVPKVNAFESRRQASPLSQRYAA